MSKIPVKPTKLKETKRELDYFESRLAGIDVYLKTPEYRDLDNELKLSVIDEYTAIKMMINVYRDRIKLLKR